jgi:hypothetical protein
MSLEIAFWLLIPNDPRTFTGLHLQLVDVQQQRSGQVADYHNVRRVGRLPGSIAC